MTCAQWDDRVEALWRSLTEDTEQQFAADLEALLAELGDTPAEQAVATFERAGFQDSTGHSDRAVPLYRQALALGLDGLRRRRATIQLASSLRNLGLAQESVALLEAELTAGRDSDGHDSDEHDSAQLRELDDAVRAFLALALSDLGRDREGLALVLQALAPHLPRYQRSTAAYAGELKP